MLHNSIKNHKSLMQKDIAKLCDEHSVTLWRKLAGKQKLSVDQYDMIAQILRHHE